ncbi:MAG: diacylglycerol kinase family protein [Bacteroidales bacterium]|nr:diacylglycerol kinase family protein [Bacteroidales bacterium]
MKKLFVRELKSFGFAFRGLFLFFKTEAHAKTHLVAAVTVIILGFVLKIKPIEWALISLAIGLVLTAESLNTAIEKLTDKLWNENNEQAAFIKDVAAGGVLIAAIAACVIGAVVFIPYLLN